MLVHTADYNKQFLTRISLIEEEIMQEEEMFLIESLTILQEGIISRTANKATKSVVGGATSAIDGLGKGLTVGAKRFFDSFIAAIKGIFKKFIDNVTRLFKSHEKWLAQNEGNIKNCDVKGMTEEIFPYWQNEQYGKKMISLQLADQDVDIILKNNYEENQIREFYLKRLGMSGKGISTDEKDKFSTDLKVFLRGGGSRMLKDSEIRTHIPNIFDYCKNYTKSYSDISQAITKLEYFCKRADKLLSVNNEELAKTNSIDPNNAKENKQVRNESIFYEFLLEETPTLKDKVENSGKATNPSELNKNISDKDKQEKSELEKRQETERQAETDVRNNASVNQGEKLKVIKTMLNVMSSFVTIRMELMEEKFKVYMRFLRKIAQKAMSQSNHTKATGKTVNNESKMDKIKSKVSIKMKRS